MEGLYRVRKRVRPWGLASHSHGVRKGDEAISRLLGNDNFQGTSQESWVRRIEEKKRSNLFTGQEGSGRNVAFERIFFCFFRVCIRGFNDRLTEYMSSLLMFR
jgi:hypothetical protein